ncbi:MAG: SRPBCC domain-containing protein [Bacteroidales bacterium]|nr:SRPBCC domain-containing protein [Bacteroidales bacterium]
MSSIDTTDKIIAITAILNCSADTAFNYFVSNAHLEKWLTIKADVELKESGKYELFWSPDDPDRTNNSTFGCKILSFEKPNYLNFEWRGNSEQKEFMNNVRPLTNVTVIFSKLDKEKTKVTVLHTG